MTATLLVSLALTIPPVAAQNADDQDVEDRSGPADDDDDDEPGPARRARRPGEDARRPPRRGRDEQAAEAAVPRFETLLRVRLDASPSAQGAVLGRTAFVPMRDGRLIRVDLDKASIDGSMQVQATHTVAAGDGLVFVVTADALAAFDASGT